jgi:DNA-binding PadR family transcriptional regulator
VTRLREAILVLLSERPMHGYEIMRQLAERSAGTWRPGSGSVYPALERLRKDGCVVADAVERHRTRYTLSDAGETEARSAGDRPWSAGRTPAGHIHVGFTVEAGHVLNGVLTAMAELLRAGTEAQRAHADDVLRDTKNQLYRILAGRC